MKENLNPCLKDWTHMRDDVDVINNIEPFPLHQLWNRVEMHQKPISLVFWSFNKRI